MYDFVIFGATGFTGQFVLEEMLRVAQKDDSITFAVAGRNLSKLQKAIDDAKKYTGINYAKEIDRIITDVQNRDSLTKMASQAKIVLNCVGPYRFYGRQVVEACIESGTHHLDISGEPQYLESMQLEFNTLAKTNQVYVIGACGFDSLPAEVGVLSLCREFENVYDINEVECKMELISKKGTKVNIGTWESAVHGFAHRNELASLRRKLFPERLPASEHKQSSRSFLSYDEETRGWYIPFPGSDKSVVHRSQRYLYSKENKRPIQYSPYFKVGSLLNAFLMMIFGFVFGAMASFEFTRNLLLKYPGFFSAGVFGDTGPTREQIAANSFNMYFTAKAWSRSTEDNSKSESASATCQPIKSHSSKPDTQLKCKLSGPDCGYVTCAICLVQSGLIILKESDAMPESGGVFPPGAAFHKTSLIDRLNSNGLSIVNYR